MSSRSRSLSDKSVPAEPKARQPLDRFVHAPQESVGYLVRRAYRAFDRTLNVGMAKRGIPSGQWSALRVLWIEDGLSQVELAERMRVERASLTLLLARMQESGYITRTPDQADRRKLRIHLTAKARQSKRHLMPLGEAVNVKATRDFSDAERESLRDLLSRLIVNLEA